MVRKHFCEKEEEGVRTHSEEHIQGQLGWGVGLQGLRATSGTYSYSPIAGKRDLRLDGRALKMSRIQQARMGRSSQERGVGGRKAQPEERAS